MNMKSIIKLICLTYLFLFLGVINPSKGIAEPQLMLEFESVVKELRNQTQVPIFLPSVVFYPIHDYSGNPSSPTSNYEKITTGNNKPEFFTSLSEYTSPTSYQISLDVTADCGGATACDFGYLVGEKIPPSGSKVPKIFSETQQQWRNDLPPIRSSENPAIVQLAQGITGYFVPYTCAARCSTSQMIWDLNGYRYTIALEQASQEVLMEMANSAILNQ
ncbi:hypothetical protein cce_5019 [Crocosphaera subtropica ATCC 51142]|uniref:Uncharacterized protein n=2 Tax=Crocosphaera TaxID=263510 RepID=B1X2K4_CROS5|nr:hypothetical protein cce_5019 [Crocosphaera subtropica ATCC 51142]